MRGHQLRIFDGEKVSSLILRYNETGDNTVLDEILINTQELANYIAYRYSSDRAEDLAQEALIKVMNSLKHYDPNISNVHTYFSTIIRNSCITQYAKAKVADDCDSIDDVENSLLLQTIDNTDSEEFSDVQELILRNKQRFTSLSPELVTKVTKSIYYLTRDGIHNKSRGIVSNLVKNFKINRVQAKILYRSTLTYMRMQRLSNSEYKNPVLQEMTILPEVREFLGVEKFAEFMCVFSGTTINIK